jgi:hypothetical protein
LINLHERFFSFSREFIGASNGYKKCLKNRVGIGLLYVIISIVKRTIVVLISYIE